MAGAGAGGVQRGWERERVWEDTGLEWSQSSPHIPHPGNAHLYLATGAIGASFEGLHCGVGYTTPFEVLAAASADQNGGLGRGANRQPVDVHRLVLHEDVPHPPFQRRDTHSKGTRS